jgi:hypothetical protein
MTSTLTPDDRLAKARATQEAIRRAAEEHDVFPTKGRTFARVISSKGPYGRKAGAIRQHNEGEIGLAFSPGEKSPLVWFKPHELERCPAPVGWP